VPRFRSIVMSRAMTRTSPPPAKPGTQTISRVISP
jgi:hypothetical protein